MSERIDLAEPVFAICERLGLHPNNVARLDIYPFRTVATVYKERDGKKYTDESGDPVTEIVELETRTV